MIMYVINALLAAAGAVLIALLAQGVWKGLHWLWKNFSISVKRRKKP